MNPGIRQSGRGSLEQEAEMLPQELPPAIARWISWLLIAIFFSVLAAAIVVQVPETIRCSFVLIPREGADPIQAPYLSTVSEVRVTEAQEVSAGAELFVLRSDEIRAKHTQLQTFSEDLRSKEEGTLRLETSHTTQLSIKNAEIAQVERELKFRQKHTETNRELVSRLERLGAGGGISHIELAKYQLDLAQSEKDLNLAQKSLESVKLERERMENERARQRGEEQSDVHKLNVRIAALKRDLENSKQDLLSIRAPYDAVVISISQRNAGNVVQSGQELCQLARLDATPRARLLLKEQGLSRLRAGHRVRLFFDAFPYQRYGTITGRLDWISLAAVASTEGQSFVARASLDQTFIRVKGEPRPLRVGMKGEARVIVGRRRLIEYAFEPVRTLRENMRP